MFYFTYVSCYKSGINIIEAWFLEYVCVSVCKNKKKNTKTSQCVASLAFLVTNGSIKHKFSIKRDFLINGCFILLFL